MALQMVSQSEKQWLQQETGILDYLKDMCQHPDAERTRDCTPPRDISRMVKVQIDECIMYQSPPQSNETHRRPLGYDNSEWLSYQYYKLNQYNSIIKNRKAPHAFLEKFLPRISGSDEFLSNNLYKDIKSDVYEEYERRYPDSVEAKFRKRYPAYA